MSNQPETNSAADSSAFTGYNVSEIVMTDLARRYNYHAPKGNQAQRYGEIRQECFKLAVFLTARCPTSRELSLALTNLDQVMFNANAAIARGES
jgi:hypothetical protein